MPLSLEPELAVTAQDRADVIDILDRLNMAFDVWNLDLLRSLHSEDFTVHHPKGTASGHDQLTAFYAAYEPLTYGVRRQHLNHVVTGHQDGTISVQSYNLLIRIASAGNADAVKGQMVVRAEPGLPAIAMHSVMIDHFRREAERGWVLFERHVEETVLNPALL